MRTRSGSPRLSGLPGGASSDGRWHRRSVGPVLRTARPSSSAARSWSGSRAHPENGVGPGRAMAPHAVHTVRTFVMFARGQQTRGAALVAMLCCARARPLAALGAPYSFIHDVSGIVLVGAGPLLHAPPCESSSPRARCRQCWREPRNQGCCRTWHGHNRSLCCRPARLGDSELGATVA